MALIACKECGKDVSTEAKTCPNCGARVIKPKAKTSKLAIAVAAFFGVSMLAGLAAKNETSKATPSQPAAPQMTAAQKAARDRQLQAAGAGAMGLKRAAKDPEAFEMKSVSVYSDGAACYEYRAKNSFGATLPGEAVLPPGGRMLVREADANAFVKAWNKLCTRDGGEEIVEVLRRLDII